MARSLDLYKQLAGLSAAPDIQRMRAQSQALRQQAAQPVSGAMIGDRYVAPHWSNNLAQLGKGFLGTALRKKADEQDREYRSELTDALRGNDAPAGVMAPGYEPPSRMERLSAIADENPYAQQMLTMQAMQGEAEPDWQQIDIPTNQGTVRGVVNMNASNPEDTFRPMGDPVQETGNISSVSPSDYTPESLAAYQKTGDYSVLVPKSETTTPADRYSNVKEDEAGRLIGYNNETGQVEALPTADTFKYADREPAEMDPTDLRKEVNKVTEDFRDQDAAFGRVLASAKDASPAGDLALIFNYMKVLDPGSVVRESEFATAAATGSYGQRIEAAVNKVMSGEKLSDDQRRDFVTRAQGLYNEARKGYENVKQGYMPIVEAQKLPVEQVFAIQPGYSPEAYKEYLPSVPGTPARIDGGSLPSPASLESNDDGGVDSLLDKYAPQ